MFDWFFNWIDPKILKMEQWVNIKVIEPDKIDVDLDKVKKGEVRKNDMFRKAVPATNGEIFGPVLVNMTGAHLMGYLSGPGNIEAFALMQLNDQLYWRHREAGTTEDFAVGAFKDMKEFFEYAHGDEGYWECALRTEALLAGFNEKTRPHYSLADLPEVVKEWEEQNESTSFKAE